MVALAAAVAALVAVAPAAGGNGEAFMFTKIQRQQILDVIKRYEAKTSGIIHVHVRKKCKESVIKDAQKYFLKRKLNKIKHHR